MTDKRFKQLKKYKYSVKEILTNKIIFEEVRDGIKNGICYIIESNIDLDKVRKFRNELQKVAIENNSEYKSREPGCANYMQMHMDHPNQIVKARFVSWSYFPWNEKSEEIFNIMRPLYILRNKMADLDEYKYIDKYDEIACARIAVQFYPRAVGYMSEHQDPENKHQFAIPTMMLSEKGKEFETGGFYVIDQNNDKKYLDHETKFGDIILFHTSIPHGVGKIDENMHEDSEININNGRMMLIAAVNAFKGKEGGFEANETKYGKI